ncbi:MAG TPA: VacJ family lipoprotein [Acetobacteraceae bacterium]|jgi:phospholipid-binding lipoprotein MlaA
MMRAPFIPALLAALVLSAALSGCATPPPADDPDAVAEFKQTNDPLEPTNRVMYAVNDALDTVILRPVAIAYRDVVPAPVRQHTRNVLDNLANPVVLANDMMQGKPRRAGDTLMRFLLNSTLGVAGIFDVATDWGWPAHDSDFGITLASWGAGEGPFLFLPILGPSNPRDAVGYGADIALDPFTWVGAGSTVEALGYSRYAVTAVDARAGALDDLDKIKSQALDPYATFRSLFRQYRANKVKTALSDDRATPPNWQSQPRR